MPSPHILVIGSESTVNAVLANNPTVSRSRRQERKRWHEYSANPRRTLCFLEVSNGTGGALHTLQQLQRDLAIVVPSALGNNRQVVDAIRLGANDYLNLPFAGD
jgi:DNA-binding NtrC family response regulator